MIIPQEILLRRSVRAFTGEDVSDADAEKLIEAACLAPSAGNNQPWGFVLVREPETKQKLVEAAHGQAFIGTAPVVIVVCADPKRTTPKYGERGMNLYCIQDTAAAVENILLTAAHNGLGACWIGAFDESMAAEAVGLPEEVRPVAMIPVGHPAQSPEPRPRRKLSEVTHRNRW